MPYAPKRPCPYPGCSELTTGGPCEKHKRQAQREYESRRGSAASQGYGSRWQRASDAFKRKHPLCVKCQAAGIIRASEEVDHVTPHRGNTDLFWDQSNWQALCKPCHSRKTAEEDGRWGRVV
jgi:5-methylcytosine-specific restriction protein A